MWAWGGARGGQDVGVQAEGVHDPDVREEVDHHPHQREVLVAGEEGGEAGLWCHWKMQEGSTYKIRMEKGWGSNIWAFSFKMRGGK